MARCRRCGKWAGALRDACEACAALTPCRHSSGRTPGAKAPLQCAFCAAWWDGEQWSGGTGAPRLDVYALEYRATVMADGTVRQEPTPSRRVYVGTAATLEAAELLASRAGLVSYLVVGASGAPVGKEGRA